MSTNNKWLYKFTVNKEKEVPETNKTKNEKGEEISITKNVKKIFPVEFHLKKPTRKLYEEGELFFGISLSEGIKAGLLTRQLLAKRYDNDGGVLSETDKQRYAELYRSLYDQENEVQRAQTNLEKLEEKEKTKAITDALIKASETRRELQDFESFRSAIFEQTAENRAKNKTLMWWILNLAYQKEENSDKINPIFGEGSYEVKLEEYDRIEEENELCLAEALKKFAYFVSFWYSGQLNKEEDFKKLEESSFPKDTEEETTKEPTTEEKAKEPSPKEDNAALSQDQVKSTSEESKDLAVT